MVSKAFRSFSPSHFVYMGVPWFVARFLSCFQGGYYFCCVVETAFFFFLRSVFPGPFRRFQVRGVVRCLWFLLVYGCTTSGFRTVRFAVISSGLFAGFLCGSQGHLYPFPLSLLYGFVRLTSCHAMFLFGGFWGFAFSKTGSAHSSGCFRLVLPRADSSLCTCPRWTRLAVLRRIPSCPRKSTMLLLVLFRLLRSGIRRTPRKSSIVSSFSSSILRLRRSLQFWWCLRRFPKSIRSLPRTLRGFSTWGY